MCRNNKKKKNPTGISKSKNEKKNIGGFRTRIVLQLKQFQRCKHLFQRGKKKKKKKKKSFVRETNLCVPPEDAAGAAGV
jgi:hypothetical protein